MIRVKYNNSYIEISGHANYADYGNDIVYASVSSIIYTTINGILNINKDTIKYSDEKVLRIDILSNDNITNTLLKNMIDILKELSLQYPKNINIIKGE